MLLLLKDKSQCKKFGNNKEKISSYRSKRMSSARFLEFSMLNKKHRTLVVTYTSNLQCTGCRKLKSIELRGFPNVENVRNHSVLYPEQIAISKLRHRSEFPKLEYGRKSWYGPYGPWYQETLHRGARHRFRYKLGTFPTEYMYLHISTCTQTDIRLGEFKNRIIFS